MTLRQEGLAVWGSSPGFAGGSLSEIVAGQIGQSAGGGYYSVGCLGLEGWSLLPMSKKNSPKHVASSSRLPESLISSICVGPFHHP